MQPWHRWREPLAVVLLVALGLMLVVRGVALAVALGDGQSGGLLGSIPGGDDLLLLAASAAVLWCATPVRIAPPGPGTDPGTGESGVDGSPPAAGAAPSPEDPSPHAWPIAVAGAVVVGLTVLGWFVLSLLTVVAVASWPTPDLGYLMLGVEGVLRLVVPAVSLVAVVLAVRRAAAARLGAGIDRQALPATPEAAAGDDRPAVEAAPERLPAAWQADEATGAVWLTADDAAQGRPGLSWADPSRSAGAHGGAWGAPGQAAVEGATGTTESATGRPAGVDDAASRTSWSDPSRAGATPAAGSRGVAPPPSAAEDDDLR
jgi:hypothetical protein